MNLLLIEIQKVYLHHNCFFSWTHSHGSGAQLQHPLIMKSIVSKTDSWQAWRPLIIQSGGNKPFYRTPAVLIFTSHIVSPFQEHMNKYLICIFVPFERKKNLFPSSNSSTFTSVIFSLLYTVCETKTCQMYLIKNPISFLQCHGDCFNYCFSVNVIILACVENNSSCVLIPTAALPK